MPVMCIYHALNVTPETYDKVRAAVRWEEDLPTGAISHTISFSKNGGVEVDLWESRAAFETYRDNRLSPLLSQLGIVIDDPEILDIYVTAIGPLADTYRLPRAVTPETQLQSA
ncbi:MAG: hypothetical protein ABI655_02230 [Phenylobacterium sp.]